jgi:integrase
MTVGALCEAWLAMIDGSTRAALTKRGYRVRLTAALLPELASMRVIDLRPAHLDGPSGLYARLRAKGVGSSSLMYAHDYLHAALRWGARRRGVPVHRSILDGAVEAPAHREAPKRPATAAEAERLIAVLAPPFGAEVATMYYAGLRDSEAAALKWRDVGTDGLSVERKRDGRTGAEGGVPKHGSEGWVPMVPRLRDLLRRPSAWASAEGHPVGPDDWVFGHVWESGPRAKRAPSCRRPTARPAPGSRRPAGPRGWPTTSRPTASGTPSPRRSAARASTRGPAATCCGTPTRP